MVAPTCQASKQAGEAMRRAEAHAHAAGDRLANDLGLPRDDPRRTEIRAAMSELINKPAALKAIAVAKLYKKGTQP